MPLARGLALASAGVLACAVAACATSPPVLTKTHASGKQARELDIRKVAVVPFKVAESYPRSDPRNLKPREAVALVERFVTEALLARGVQVISAGDVRTALNLTDPDQPLPPNRIVSMVAAQKFGVPAVVTGTVYRMRDVAPEAMGATRAASVWFEVDLLKAPGATLLWDATFNETQKPLSENVFNASKYPGGGMRWLRAEELARWGASELARQFPTGLPPTPTHYR